VWKKYLTIPAVICPLAMALLLVLGFEADTKLGHLPQLLPLSVCSNLPLHLGLAVALLFSAAKVNVEGNVKVLRILLAVCLLASAGGFAIATWGTNTYAGIGLIMLAALTFLTSVSSWPVTVVAVALLVSSILLVTRLWKTRPPKMPWEY